MHQVRKWGGYLCIDVFTFRSTFSLSFALCPRLCLCLSSFTPVMYSTISTFVLKVHGTFSCIRFSWWHYTLFSPRSLSANTTPLTLQNGLKIQFFPYIDSSLFLSLTYQWLWFQREELHWICKYRVIGCEFLFKLFLYIVCWMLFMCVVHVCVCCVVMWWRW